MNHAFRDRSPAVLAAAGPAGALVLALIVIEGRNTHYLPTQAATILTGVLCVAALFVPAARFPLVTAGAVAASLALSATSTQMAHRPENTPGMTELCALLLIVTRTVRQQSVWWCAALVPTSGVAALLVFFRLPRGDYGDVVQLAAPIVLLGLLLALLLGLYLRLVDTTRDQRDASQRQALRQAERLEYARELHDFVAHHVTAIVAQAKAVRYVTSAGHAPDPSDLDRMLAGIEQAGSQAIDSMRSMVSVLRAPGESAVTRPGSDLTRLRDLVDGFASSGTSAELTLDPRLTGRDLPPEITTTVHRLVQESLTNIRKHGREVGRVAVVVRLRPDDPGVLDAAVTDDGRPPAEDRAAGDGTRDEMPCGTGGGPEEPRRPPRAARSATATREHREGPPRRGGFGLVGLAERVEDMGGTFTAGPRLGGAGWEVAAELPLPSAPAEPAR